MYVVLLLNRISETPTLDEVDVLQQCAAVESALKELGHRTDRLSIDLNLSVAHRELKRLQPDLVFNLVESFAGTDRLMPLAALLLESMDIPFTGASSQAMAATSGKINAKQLMQSRGLPTGAWRRARDPEWHGLRPGRAILKAVWEHASFGMDDSAVVDLQAVSDAELVLRLEQLEERTGTPHFAEQYIDGREFNLTILSGPAGPQVLPPAEIQFVDFPAGKPRIVGYAAKWEEQAAEFQNTPRTFEFSSGDQTLLRILKELALRCWQLFQLRGYARVDFRVDESGCPWVLEINVNPCLSLDAGFAAAVERAGMAYRDAIRHILQAGLRQTDAVAGEAGKNDLLPADSGSVRRNYGPDSMRLEAIESDRHAVRRIVESTGFFSDAELDVAVELVDERLKKGDASDYHFVFAESEGQVIGYACFGPIACTIHSFDVYWIAVDRQHQGCGLGRWLMEQCELRIRMLKGQRIYVETSGRPQYLTTREFYRRCGYDVAAVFPDFYDRGDDKIVFLKTI